MEFSWLFIQVNCELELYLSWTSDCVITEVLNATVHVGFPEVKKSSITGATFQITNAKHYPLQCTLSAKVNINFSENLKQEIKRTRK